MQPHMLYQTSQYDPQLIQFARNPIKAAGRLPIILSHSKRQTDKCLGPENNNNFLEGIKHVRNTS